MRKFFFNVLPVIFIVVSTGFFLSGNNTLKHQNENTVQSLTDVTEWKVSGRQVLLNGNPFFAKGVGYQPIPVGTAPGLGEPYGDYFTSNYANIYKPDIDRMKDMYVNVIKIYSWFPDRDHTDFLNYAYSKGIYVLVGYYMPADYISNKFDEMLGNFRMLAENTKTHPAIMGYMLGNENITEATRNDTKTWNRLNQIASNLKSIAPNKLVTTGLVDDGMLSIKGGDASMTSLDVWGINVFRSKSLGDFYSSYLQSSKKPVFITELGFPATERVNGNPQAMSDNGEDVAEYMEDVLKEVSENSSDDEPNDPVAGVFLFMFCDEWWKQECTSCSVNTHDFSNNKADGFPGGWWDEEWFGIYTADRQPRAVVKVLRDLWD